MTRDGSARFVSILVVALLLVGLAVFVPALWQAQNARKDLYAEMEGHGRALAETLAGGIAHAVEAHDAVLSLIETLLRDAAAELAEASGREVESTIHHARVSHGPAVVVVWNSDGTVRSRWPDGTSPNYPSPDPRVLAGRAAERVYGFFEDPVPDPPVFGVMRARKGGGAVYVGADPDSIEVLRHTFGVGQLVREAADRAGVWYVIVQDPLGIIAAAGAIADATTFDTDPVLHQVWSSRDFASRRRDVEGDHVVEFVAPYELDGEIVALIRIAVSAASLERLEQRFRTRILLSSVIFLLGVIAAGGVARGVIDFRRREARYQAAEVRTEEILNSIADGVLVLDAEDRVLAANPRAERILDGRFQEWSGRRAADVPELAPVAAAVPRDVPRGEARITTATGRQLRLVVTSLEQPDTHSHAVVVVVQDETDADRLRTLERRAEQWTTVSHMAGAAAHEIRNPLNSISMFVQRLGSPSVDDRGPESDRDDRHLVRREIARIDDIVTRFLKVARPPEPVRIPARLDICMAQVAETFRRTLREETIRFKTEIEIDLHAHFDCDLIQEAVLNLLGNARDAIGEVGHIVLRARRQGQWLVITIEDDGPGVPFEERDRVFDLYYTTKADGSGLGLPLSHHIARSHQGALEAGESALGGARFDLRIPAEDD